MNFSLKRSFVLVLLIQCISHYRVSKVIRKHGNVNNSHPNCLPPPPYRFSLAMLKRLAVG